MNLLDTIKVKCAKMKRGTNRVQIDENKKKSEFGLIANPLFSYAKIGRGERI